MTATEAETRTVRLDALARALMDTRPDLEPMSLGEWVWQHHERLTDAERRSASAISALY